MCCRQLKLHALNGDTSMEHAVEHEEDDAKVFGFWIYIMTDLVIFGALFAAFIVLRHATSGGPANHELFYMPAVLEETLLLLTSTFTCAVAMIEVHRGRKLASILWFLVTFALGVGFLVLEISEFAKFISEGAGPDRSASLSSFFTLVGTHGFHIFWGLVWMAVMMVRIAVRPLVPSSISRIFRMALFWHFLDFVWIFIFTIVYGMGHLL